MSQENDNSKATSGESHQLRADLVNNVEILDQEVDDIINEVERSIIDIKSSLKNID